MTHEECNNPECSISSGIFDEITFGSGELDDFGYWEFGCLKCAEAWVANHPNDITIPKVTKEKKQ